MKRIFLVALSVIFYLHLQAQQFAINVSAVNNKVRIEWVNPYRDSVVQLNIQRSWDSVKNFRTIFVPLSPELPQNGYVDETAGYPGMYYRAFYVLANGSFFFTKAKKVTSGLDFTNEVPVEQANDTSFLVTIHDDDSVIAQLSYNGYKHFKDSIINYTRDTLYSLSDADILIRYYNNDIKWIPSTHVFTTSDGYVQIYLADALQNNYKLRVLDENHKQLFVIQHITQPQLLLDKTDFMQSGWYYFELFENDKLKERNKFYIPKDF
ncbi:MAG TPA: hypothetical protein VEV62_02645 [Parafilimonas sp.]|nr:hypothetical protein [Parafilimonas sp.]